MSSISKKLIEQELHIKKVLVLDQYKEMQNQYILPPPHFLQN